MQLQMDMAEDVYQRGMQGYLFACLFCPIVYVRVIVCSMLQCVWNKNTMLDIYGLFK